LIKICFISGGLKGGGGMERSLTSLANHFSRLGHEVTIIILFKTEIYFELDPRIKVTWPNLERNKFHRLIYAISIVPFFRKTIRRLKPDVLLSFGEWFNPYVILATRFLKIPLYVSDRMGPDLNLGYLLETSRKLTYRHANGIIAQTDIAAALIRKKTRSENIKVIPNAVNFIDTNTSTKKKQIVTVGRLSREKGHSVLLKAFSRLFQKEWTLHIVGDGPEMPALQDEAKRLNIGARVIFYGHQKDFNKVLGESLIFVLPSFLEGFPNALVEAMSVPLACVSTDCTAGPADIIKNGENGLLLPTGDCDAMASALNILIEDEGLRNHLSQNAYKVRETLNFERTAERYLDFISQSLS
jgi:GalNAc-alpha-(1->4)-GalNAc-alpha-(1->3)-diNAcBac-PP-undecaprenol alpha-1,4-N-acetyl-D-galactosaminyltransferase